MDTRGRIQRIKGIVAEQRRLYDGDPNVHSIGWGAPTRKGTLMNEVAITFFVHEKLPDADAIRARGSKPIPPAIEGYPTDVEAGSLVRSASSATGDRDKTIRNPLVGGVASSNAAGHIFVASGYGTLGLLCRDAEGRAMALSNWHVWADDGEAGDNIIQPGHPTAADHVLSVFETLACGPLLGAVVNTNLPSPLTAGLYAGAAAAAVAAAASDRIDPTRRGQEATPVPAGVTTGFEEVEMAIEYPDLPWPGTPFRARPTWTYSRHTSAGILTHEVTDEQVLNTQFLIGHVVVSDRSSYDAAETATVHAVLWDHKARPCDAYHVAIHLIPEGSPTRAVREVLKPGLCSAAVNRLFPTGGSLCIRFSDRPEREVHQRASQIDWLSIQSLARPPIVIGPAPGGGTGLRVPPSGLRFRFHPASAVTVRLLPRSGRVTLRAFDAFRNEVASAISPPGGAPLLTVTAPLITSVELAPQSGNATLEELCINPIASETFSVPIDPAVARQLQDEGSSVACTTDPEGNEICVLNVRRCCFERSYEISSVEGPDHWRGYLTVQNLNTVAAGTDPLLAARTIGGHVLTPSAFIIGCAVFHAADVEYDSK